MRTIIITDEVDEYLALKDDGERSALVQKTKGMFPDWRNEKVVVLNPRQEQRLKDAITAIQRERAGQKGGNSTLMKYGNDHFSEIGQKGGRPGAKTLSSPSASNDKGGIVTRQYRGCK